MNFDWKKVEGSQLIKPPTFEKDEQTGYVWLRKNITEIEKQDEMSGTTIKLWKYDELGLNKTEYEEYLKYQQSVDTKEEIDNLKTENQMLTDCILEMSEIIYGGEL